MFLLFSTQKTEKINPKYLMKNCQEYNLIMFISLKK